MKSITFYSYKGGVGRSLALANIANRLADFGKKVCMLDFDLEAPGLHVKFSHRIGENGIKNGLVDYIHHFTTKNEVPGNINDFVTDINSYRDDSNKISLIAAGNTSSATYWKKLSSINWMKLFYEEDSQGVDFFFNLKAQIEKQIAPDVLLIDSRTGITDLAGVTMSILADEIVLIGANNKENLEGIGHVLKALLIPDNSIKNKVPKIKFVLSRIPYFPEPKDKAKETNARNAAIRSLNVFLQKEKISNFEVEKMFVIHSDPELELQEVFKINMDVNIPLSTKANPITSDYLELFEELTSDIIGQDEIAALENYRKAEVFFKKALGTSELIEKKELLKKAIALNTNFHLAHMYLGMIYSNSGAYEKALAEFEKTAKITSQHNDNIALYKASILYNQKNHKEAIEILTDVIKKGRRPHLFAAYGMLGSVYSRLKEYDKAVRYFKKAIMQEPENSDAWNFYGNGLRLLNRYDEAFDAVFKALELAPQNPTATATLAELYAATGNSREFYKNIDLALSLGLKPDFLQKIVKEDNVYLPYFNDEKFQEILEKYNVEIDWDEAN